MNIALEKKAHVFRLPVSLLEKLKELARNEVTPKSWTGY